MKYKVDEEYKKKCKEFFDDLRKNEPEWWNEKVVPILKKAEEYERKKEK